MSSSLAVLWLLTAVLGEAFSLECITCNNTAEKICAASSKTCPKDKTHCLIILSEGKTISQVQTTTDNKMQMVLKSCGVLKDCDQTYSMSAGITYQNSVSKCCTSKDCNKNLEIVLPVKSTNKNGVTCPSCNSTGEKCMSIGSVECLGTETVCINYTATIKQGTSTFTYTVQGCATPSMCTLGATSVFPGADVDVKHWTCSHATTLIPTLLFPLVSGLLWLKLLS